MRRTLFGLLLVLVGCSSQSEDEQKVVLSEVDAGFVQAFMGSCVMNFGDRARVRSAAKALGWRPIRDEATKALIAPKDRSASWDGWKFVTNSHGYIVTLSDANIDGRNVATCALMSQLTSVSKTKSRIAEILKAEKADSAEAGGQRTEMWKIDVEGDPRILTFIDAEQMGMKMLNASVSTDWTKSQ